jgi:hypothetical protein
MQMYAAYVQAQVMNILAHYLAMFFSFHSFPCIHNIYTAKVHLQLCIYAYEVIVHKSQQPAHFFSKRYFLFSVGSGVSVG